LSLWGSPPCCDVAYCIRNQELNFNQINSRGTGGAGKDKRCETERYLTEKSAAVRAIFRNFVESES
ncbi:MAG: hypothetical protein K2G86_04560, partial [Prevotella sp.]|nr:hypothetical protein [Prevotella sp.]